MAHWCKQEGVEVWAYCLMPNHVHLVAVPSTEQALRRGIAEAHRRYSRRINFREGWRGHLWQGRFASFPMDDDHLYLATPYVELNPVRAGLANVPDGWRWSSAAAHLAGCDDRLVRVEPLLEALGDWREFLSSCLEDEDIQLFRHHERSGRPLGNGEFVEKTEKLVWDASSALASAAPKAPGNTRRAIIEYSVPRLSRIRATAPPRPVRRGRATAGRGRCVAWFMLTDRGIRTFALWFAADGESSWRHKRRSERPDRTLTIRIIRFTPSTLYVTSCTQVTYCLDSPGHALRTFPSGNSS